MPVTIVTWLIRTAFIGTKSTGKTVLLRTDLFDTTDETPFTNASLLIRNGTSLGED